MPRPPAPPRQRNGWKVATIILAVFVVVLLAGYLWSLVADLASVDEGLTRLDGPRLEEVLVDYRHADHKIAVIPVEGVISTFERSAYNMVSAIKAELKLAQRDKHVKAVVLKVDSPGGEVLASDDINRAITEFQKESGKPVVASMASLAASGGYYVSVPCRWIVANELTITGSIGVLLQSFNFRGLMDKIGLRPETYKSGKYKDMLSGMKKETEITDEERSMVQGLVNETFERFKMVVAEGRRQANQANKTASEPGRQLNTNWTEYADGRVLSGKQAYELGFVDEMGDFETAVTRAKKLARIDKANLIEYRPVFDLSSLFRLFGQSDVGRIKIDWGVEMPRLKAGHLYFLAPNYVH
jgi:protease-4